MRSRRTRSVRARSRPAWPGKRRRPQNFTPTERLHALTGSHASSDAALLIALTSLATSSTRPRRNRSALRPPHRSSPPRKRSRRPGDDADAAIQPAARQGPCARSRPAAGPKPSRTTTKPSANIRTMPCSQTASTWPGSTTASNNATTTAASAIPSSRSTRTTRSSSTATCWESRRPLLHHAALAETCSARRQSLDIALGDQKFLSTNGVRPAPPRSTSSEPACGSWLAYKIASRQRRVNVASQAAQLGRRQIGLAESATHPRVHRRGRRRAGPLLGLPHGRSAPRHLLADRRQLCRPGRRAQGGQRGPVDRPRDPDSPAQAAGIRDGDRIVAVGGQSTSRCRPTKPPRC